MLRVGPLPVVRPGAGASAPLDSPLVVVGSESRPQHDTAAPATARRLGSGRWSISATRSAGATTPSHNAPQLIPTASPVTTKAVHEAAVPRARAVPPASVAPAGMSVEGLSRKPSKPLLNVPTLRSTGVAPSPTATQRSGGLTSARKPKTTARSASRPASTSAGGESTAVASADFVTLAMQLSSEKHFVGAVEKLLALISNAFRPTDGVRLYMMPASPRKIFDVTRPEDLLSFISDHVDSLGSAGADSVKGAEVESRLRRAYETLASDGELSSSRTRLSTTAHRLQYADADGKVTNAVLPSRQHPRAMHHRASIGGPLVAPEVDTLSDLQLVESDGVDTTGFSIDHFRSAVQLTRVSYDLNTSEPGGSRRCRSVYLPVMDAKGRVFAVFRAITPTISAKDIKAKEAPTTAALALFGHTFSRLMQEYVSRKDCSLSTRAIMNFLRMVQALASSVDARAVVTVIMQHTYELITPDRVSVFLVDRETQELVLEVSEDATGIRLPLTKGIAGHVTLTGQHVNVADVSEDPRFDKNVDKKTGYCTKSLLCMPVKDPDGSVLAVIQAVNKSMPPYRFTDDDVELMNAVAAIVCIPLHSAKALLHSTRIQEQSLALVEVIKLANNFTENTEELLALLNRSAHRVVDAAFITLFLIDDVKRELFSSISKGDDHRIPFGCGVAGNVAVTKAAVCADQMCKLQHYDPAYDLLPIDDSEKMSCLCIPLVDAHSGTVVGVLKAVNKIGGGPFSAADQELLQGFAYEVAAILKRKLHDAAYDRVIAKESGATGSMVSEFTHASKRNKFRRSSGSNNSLLTSDDLETASVSESVAPEYRRRSTMMSARPPLRGSVAVPGFAPIGSQRKLLESIAAESDSNPSSSASGTPSPDDDPTLRDSAITTSSIAVEHEAYGDSMQSLEFDVLPLSRDELCACVLGAMSGLGLVDSDGLLVDVAALSKFTNAIADQYRPNPYHNFHHGVSVMHVTYACMLSSSLCESLLAQLDHVAVLLSALCHDVDHPGTNNVFQINTCSDVALTYNDASVLENHHAAVMFRTLRRPGMNPVPLLSPEEFRRFRKLCLVSILATDMTEHAALTTTIQSLPTKVADAWPSTEESVVLMSRLLLHCADLSNPLLPDFDVVSKWANMVCVEFSNQVNEEKRLGLPFAQHMDNLNTPSAVAKLQVGFISYVVAPLWKAMVVFFPEQEHLIPQMERNRSRWEEISKAPEPEACTALAPTVENAAVAVSV